MRTIPEGIPISEQVVEHVFLPTKVTADSTEILGVEGELLPELLVAIEEFVKSIRNETYQKRFQSIINTFKTWESIQCQDYMDPKLIMEGIRALSPGESFPLYIRAQNAGLMITIPLTEVEKNGNGNGDGNGKENGLSVEEKQKQEHETYESKIAILSSFPANLESDEVTSNPGSLAAIFPAIALCIPRTEILNSKCLGRQLSALSSYQTADSLKTINKAGHAVTEVREVANPFYVTHWLAGVLSNDQVKPAPSKFFPRVVKKIRDAVVFEVDKSVIPFRRSGLWMTAKSVLQLCLVQHLGEANGMFAYKLIMIKFLLSFLRETKFRLYAYPWVTMEMLGKIARRCRKLQLFQRSNFRLSKSERLTPYLVGPYEDIFSDAAQAIKRIHGFLKLDWNKLIEDHRKLQQREFLIRDGLKPVETHAMLHSGYMDYITVKRHIFIAVSQVCVPDPIIPSRHRETSRRMKRQYLTQPTEDELPYVLYDFERNVRNWDYTIKVDNYEYVWEIFSMYIRIAKPYYVKDPVGSSRMILTCLKMLQVWDKIVTHYYPMLHEHRCGIDLSFTKDLLIPDQEGMELILRLEDYFGYRDAFARLPSLIEEPEIVTHSFTARYGATLPELTEVRNKILRDSEHSIELKIQEVQRARHICDKLKIEIKNLECEYVYTHWRREHNPACKKCNLSRQYKNSKVKVYERPLPTNEECQYAVLLELVMPEPIACLRDILYLFGHSVTSTILPVPREALHGPWINYEPLESYLDVNHRFHFVTLMSTKKLFLESHYDNLHPTNPDSDFIKNNGYNCRLAGTGELFVHSQSTKAVKALCTLRVTKNTPYASLQYAIDGECVTPNQVLARQNECHPDLSLQEFVEFGSLRCFSRLQLRNIYRALTQMTLSLKNESVFNLICQCMWQTGPPMNAMENQENMDPNHKTKSSTQKLFREAHEDLQDPVFMCYFLELMEKYRERQSHNWKDHYVLLAVIVIACRVAELSEHGRVVGLAVELLEKCRQNAIAWSTEVRGILSSSTNAPRTEVDLLRIKMIEINACCALTFSVGVDLTEEILDDLVAVKSWLISVANIYDNIVLIGSGRKSQKEVVRVLPITLQNILRRVQETGLLIEPYLRSKIKRGEDVFTPFVKEHYSGSAELIGLEQSKWKPFSFDAQIYRCELEAKTGTKMELTTILQMDVVGGGFLVDGCPVSYLPSNIENHPLFQRTFPTKSFSVGPYPFQRGRMMSLETFLNSEKVAHHCARYSFFLQADGSLIVTEHRYAEKDEMWQLLPHHILERNIPNILVDDFTHWWNKEQGLVEFFKRERDSPSKLFLKEPVYRFNMRTSFLTELSSGRQMVDINCQIFQKILAVLARLEHYKFINLWHDPNKKNCRDYVVELPRMGLKFKLVNQRGLIVLTSKEYRGMKVSDGSEPEVATLIGLRNGLLLIDADIRSKTKLNSILLVPHGTPIIGDNRSCVKIRNEVLRSPTFFAYEIDSRLRQLKAGESQAGWAFLAYLHATTTSHLPDPFTGVTGTERAFQILQSGHCWSAEPMDQETLRTLRHIAKLSPERKYYPPNLTNMESVKWPLVGEDGLKLKELPPHVAHDGYQLIVEKLISDSVRLEFLFHPDQSIENNERAFEFRGERDLSVKAYWRRIRITTELGRIRSTFDDEFDMANAPRVTPSTSFSSDFIPANMNSVTEMAQLGHSWMCRPPITSFKLLKKLIMDGKDLQGLGEVGFTCKEDWRFWELLDFRDSWISLYELARGNVRKDEEKKKGKYDLAAEWVHLLTHLSFRKNGTVDFEHLAVLQTIAVNYSMFQTINPPPYQEYFMTDEYEFNYNEIVKVFSAKAILWKTWMDKQEAMEERRPDESKGDFIDRMRPIYELEIETYSKDLADIIKKQWPIDSCDELFLGPTSDVDIPTQIWNSADFSDALLGANTLLRNWYRNRLLFNFLDDVEEMVNLIQKTNLNVSTTPFINTSKAWTKNCPAVDKRSLKHFCERAPLYTIDFDDVIGERPESEIDQGFHEEVENIFNGNSSRGRNKKLIESPPKSSGSGTTTNVSPEEFPLRMDTQCPILGKYLQDLEMSWTECQKGIEHLKPKIPILAEMVAQTSQEVLNMWEKVKNVIKPQGHEADDVTLMLIKSEIFPRVTPLSLFPLVCRQDFATAPEKKYLNYIRNMLGAYGVLLTHDQQSARCVRYKVKGKESLEVELKSELSNPGHENWNPSERPEWLLFELEMDLMVRPMQAKVAERMENPEDAKNALLQLNMGEGKTAVIVPLLALSLANGKRLCRVTVLKSLFEINQKALISRIGGLLLNRRVYVFPCRRDFEIGHKELSEMFRVYKECMRKRGVVIGLAEHRLSFKLKSYETCGAENFEEGRQLLEVQEWLNANSRDVLDESDEILHVKYQLIYTLGKQKPISGGSSRWTIIQKVLRIIPKMIQIFSSKLGSSIEFKFNEETPQAFPYFRLLKPDCNELFCQAIVEEILSGTCGMPIPEITAEKKPLLVNFLTNEKLGRDEINAIYALYPLQVHQEILLILRGLLACSVLSSAMSKRWRVNYGVNPSGYRRMAVPFRAKDLAAERTEFGHPDIAIVLTQLCYYYSGLNDEQLEQCFVNLALQPDPELEYQRWVDLVPNTLEGYESIRHLSGINLKDFFQRTRILFPALFKNTATIDFWLGTVVYPHESKQFSWKIGCSPWDLCLESDHPSTGFSGTNDSKLLLPKTICQKDLPELQGTNGEVLRHLLRKENDNYEALPLGFTGTQILKKLVRKNIKLLLDVGALMLELNNAQVAKTWLDLVGEENEGVVDAAVYFDDANKLVVIDRTTKVPVSLETSTYRTRLDSCVIYLDDAHTRGTDLKIPSGVRGCVTLGKGVTKDKLVQGCMRMRKLGQGHTVIFWASNEVDNAISSLVINQEKIGTKQVLQWAIENSRCAIEEGFIHWASAGVYQAQKLSSHVIFNASKKTDYDLKLLADGCSEKETVDLKTMYGEVRTMKVFPVIVNHLLKRVNRELQKRLNQCAGGSTSTKVNVNKIVETFGEVVVSHSKQYVPEITRLSQCLEEEQERELEHEQEAQHEKEPPPKIKSHDHSVSDGVRKYICLGHLNEIERWAVKLPLVLRYTRVWNKGAMDTWGQHIYASQDFCRVTKSSVTAGTSESKSEDILRPPHWIASVSCVNQRLGRSLVFLLISPYEANYFLSYFRSGKTAASLHMFAPRLCPEQDTLYRVPELIIPSVQRFSHPLPSSVHSALLIFSGSSYFVTKDEQDDYCRFAGFCLKERSRMEEEVFQQGGIVNGFLDPKYFSELGYGNCRFAKNPEALIKGIIELRNGSFYNDSHVGIILIQQTKPFQN